MNAFGSIATAALALCWPGALAARPLPTVAQLAPDATRVFAQTGGVLRVWLRDGKSLAVLRSKTPLRASLAGGVLVGVFDGALAVRRGPAYRRRVSLAMPRRGAVVQRTALSANGQIAGAIYAADGGAGDATAAAFWVVRTGRRLAEVRLRKGRLHGLVLSADGRRAALFGDVGRRLAVVSVYALPRSRRLARKSLLRLFRWQSVEDRTTFAAALAKGGRLLAVGAGKRILVWHVDKKRLLATRSTRAALALFPPRLRQLRFPAAHQLAFSADGKELASLHALGISGVARWRVRDLAPLAWLPRPAGVLPRQLVWAAAGGPSLVTTARDGRVTLYTARGRAFGVVRHFQARR